MLASGIRYLAHGDSITTISDLFGISVSSTRRIINMFLDAVDYNELFAPLQIKLPDPTDLEALDELAQSWQSKSSAFGLLHGHLGALDGYFPMTEMPFDVINQDDYFSGHYQRYGLNIQAMCDPDLLFIYFATVAPGKTNDMRAFGWCKALHEWLEALPDEYFVSADNAYQLSKQILIPFSGAEGFAESNLVYNYYLSQLRIRIEMAFGRMTTKWRRLRYPLNCASTKNCKIVRVCAKLHNFCIRMKQARGGGYPSL